MSEEVRARIFEPFFTTKEVGKGTGLGLAVVHGGSSSAAGMSADQCGRCRDDIHSLLPGGPTGRLGSGVGASEVDRQGYRDGPTVEDEDAVRMIARIGLESQGYTVLAAAGGGEAIGLAGSHAGPIQLLVTDVVMPEMSGRQIAGAIRAHRPGIRVLYMSGYTDDAVVLHGVVGATDAFLQKPFTPLGLARKARAVLDGTG